MNFKTALLLLAACLIIIILSLFAMPREDYWADEIWSSDISRLSSPREIWQFLKGDTNSPLHYLFIHYASKILDPLRIDLRWTSVFWGIIGLLAVYCWMLWGFGRRPAILALFLLAFSPYWLNYCREMRMYAMLSSLLWWGSACLTRAAMKNKKHLWILSALFSALAFLTHYYAIFFISAQAVVLYILLRRTEYQNLRAGLRLWCLVLLLTLSPFLGYVWIQASNNLSKIGWVPTPQWYGLLNCYFSAFITYSASHLRPELNLLWIWFPITFLVFVFFYSRRSAQFSHSLILQSSHSPILQFSNSSILPFSNSSILPFSHSPILPFSNSPTLRFSASPLLRFSASPILPVFLSFSCWSPPLRRRFLCSSSPFRPLRFL